MNSSRKRFSLLEYLHGLFRVFWQPVVLAVLIFGLSFGIVWQVSLVQQARLVEQERSELHERIDGIGNAISSATNRRQALLTGLTAFVETHANAGTIMHEFEDYAAGLQANDPFIRAIQVYPPVGSVMVYPQAGNEATLGRTLSDLIHDERPDVRMQVERAIRTGKATFSDPYTLRQGGQGMVARQAVYRDEKLWGIVVVVLNLDPLLEIPGLRPVDEDMRVALKDTNGVVFYGDGQVFESDPVALDVQLPDGNWQVAAVPLDGWLASGQAEIRNLRLIGLLVSFLLGSLGYQITWRQSSLTGQVQARTAELSASMEEYRMLFEHAAEAIVIADPFGNCLEVNENYCQLLGYTREEILTLNVRDLVAEDELDSLNTRLSELNQGWHGPSYERRMRRKDGSIIVVEIKSQRLPDGRVQALLRDITQRKSDEEKVQAAQAEAERLLELADQSRRALLSMVEDQKEVEAALRESEERYRSLVQNIPVGVVVHKPDTSILFSNPMASNLLGLTPDQMRGKTAMDPAWRFIREDGTTLPLTEYPVNRGLRSDQSAPNVILGIIRPDRTGPTWVQSNAHPNMDVNDHLQQIIVTFFDVTQRKQADENLRKAHAELEQRVIERTLELKNANQSLEKAARLKDEFLASMSHELRTPLTGILGLSEAMQMVTYGELNEKQRHAVKNIELSGRHLLSLINDILDLSKIEAGKVELQIEPCSLGELCQAGLQLTRGMAGQKHQNVRFRMQPASIIIKADARRLKQMLVNLLGNAIKFTPDGGNLGIEVIGDIVMREARIVVWDEGIGIHADDLPRLFKPFVQLDSRLSRQYSGSGLGLSLVQSLAELHDGRVEVESELGKGSRFTIVLPWAEAAADSVPDALPRTGQLLPNLDTLQTGPLVLMADDNDMVLELVSDFLVSRNYRVSTTHSGIEFLERMEHVRADIILMDIQMPGMDGIDVIRHIRAHPDARMAALPIVAVTALAMAGDRERCLAAGANAYLSKPVQLRELIETIERLCR